MSNNNSEQSKKSFWHRFIGGEDDVRQAETVAEQPALEPEPAAAPTPVADDYSVAPPQEDTAPPATATAVTDKPAPNIDDIKAWAERLLENQEEKQREAQSAAAQAAQAEALSRLAGLDDELRQAQLHAARLQQESTQAQQDAMRALQELNESERAQVVAMAALETARHENEALQQASVQSQALRDEYQQRIDEARRDLAELEENLVQHREAAALAIKQGREAEEDVEKLNAQREADCSRGNEAIRLAARQTDEAKSALEAAQRQIKSFETRLAQEQQGFAHEKSALDELEQHLQYTASVCAERTAAVEQLREEQRQKAEEQATAVARRTAQLKRELEERQSDDVSAQAEAERTAIEAAAAAQSLSAAKEQLYLLDVEQQEAERALSQRVENILAQVETARDEAKVSKDDYLAVQREMEQSTTSLVQANARAINAEAIRKQAEAELNDANLAWETAQKLKTDATAAKSDSSSSQLLSKAEMVLIGAIERTSQLRNEKQTAYDVVLAEAERRKQDAKAIQAEAARATKRANDRVAVWLAAEENLVKLTARAEAEQGLAEKEKQNLREDYSARISAAQQELKALQQPFDQAVSVRDRAKEQATASNQALTQAQQQLDEYIAVAQAQARERQAANERQLAERTTQVEWAETVRQGAEQEFNQGNFRFQRIAADFETLMEQLRQEKEQLQQQLDRCRQRHESCEAESERLENEHKQRLTELDHQLDELEASLAASKKTAADEAEMIRLIKQAYSDAGAVVARREQEAEQAMQAEQERLRQLLLPVQEKLAQAQERSGRLAAELSQRRSAAENSLRLAVDKSNQRSAALTAVNVCKLNSQLVRLEHSGQPLYREAEREKANYEAAQASYISLEQSAQHLRDEEQQFNDNFAARMADIEADKGAELAAINAPLEQMSRDVEEYRRQADAAKLSLQQCKDELERAVAETERVRLQHEDIQARVKERLQQLSEQYQLDEAQADQGRPQLRQEAETAAVQAEAARLRANQAEAAYHEQSDLTQSCAAAEQNAPQQAAAEVARINDEQQALINQARSELAALEARQEELRESWRQSKEYAKKAQQARDEAEEELARLQADREKEQAAVEAQIAVIQAEQKRGAELVAQAAAARDELEQTVANSRQLIEAAEESQQQAAATFAQSQIELEAAKSAQVTATNLARQAASSFANMDESTAAIMRRASEDLFSAADNAAAAVAEKEAELQQAEQRLQRADESLQAVRQAVGSAPEQLEQARQSWQLADSEAIACSERAQKEIPALRRRLRDFLQQREQEINSVTLRLQRRREEAESTAAATENCNLSLQELASAISTQSVQVQNAEMTARDVVSEAELWADSLVKQKRRELAEAQNTADLLLQQQQQARATYEQAVQLAQQTAAAYQQRDAVYQQAHADLTADYERERAAAEAEAEAARQQYAAAVEHQQQDEAAVQAATAAQSNAILTWQTTLEARERQLRRQEETQQLRLSLLRNCEEEKLRLLGAKTIARIQAEEAADQAMDVATTAKNGYDMAVKRVSELEQAIATAQRQLEQLQAPA